MKQHTKIEVTEAVKRWNAQVEIADIALALAADDVTSPRKLYSLLNVTGHHSLAASLREAGSALGYFGNDRPRDPGECSADATGEKTKTTPLWQQVVDLGKQAQPDYIVEDNRRLLREAAEKFTPHWRTYQDMARQRDEMRTTLKQCRQALLRSAIHGGRDIAPMANAALDRINSLIPPSEI